jgi:mRNA interferase YafQ
MRVVDWATEFKRDFRRAAKTFGPPAVQDALNDAFKYLQTDEPLPERFRDHPLGGQWKGCRDCHVFPDLVLIYTKFGPLDGGVLFLMRLDSHSDLFGK